MNEVLLRQFLRAKRALYIFKKEGIKGLLSIGVIILWELLKKPWERKQQLESMKKYKKILASANIVNGLIETQILGYKMKLPADDPGISCELLVNGIHERETVELLRSLLHDKMTIIDIGANLGFYALLEASMTSDDTRIFAIEPSPRNVSILRENIRINNLEGKIKVFELGISDYVGSSIFYLEDKSNRHHIDKFKMGSVKSNNSIEIQVTTVDEFCKEHMIDEINLLRLDVEGHEYAVIDGAHEILSRSKNCIIFMELHPKVLFKLGKSPESLLEDLRHLGFKCIAVCGSTKNKILKMPEWNYLINNLNSLVAYYGNRMFFSKKQRFNSVINSSPIVS